MKDKLRPGNASKPMSLWPLKLDAAVATLLKVKPPVKPEKQR
jgi:hypothetical protein